MELEPRELRQQLGSRFAAFPLHSAAETMAVCRTWSEYVQQDLDDGLLATGSVGRSEAVPTSDLDVIRIAPGNTDKLQWLLAAGVLGDQNGVNPAGLELPTTIEEWNLKGKSWIADPSRDRGVVKIGLLADAASGGAGAAKLLDPADLVPGTAFVGEMLRDAISYQPVKLTGLFRRGFIDVKTDFLTPITKIARWGALASGAPRSSGQSTPQRLISADSQFIRVGHAKALAAGHSAALTLRLQQAFGQLPPQVAGRGELLRFNALPAEAQQNLRRAAKALREFKKVNEYLLSTSAFHGSDYSTEGETE